MVKNEKEPEYARSQFIKSLQKKCQRGECTEREKEAVLNLQLIEERVWDHGSKEFGIFLHKYGPKGLCHSIKKQSRLDMLLSIVSVDCHVALHQFRLDNKRDLLFYTINSKRDLGNIVNSALSSIDKHFAEIEKMKPQSESDQEVQDVKKPQIRDISRPA